MTINLWSLHTLSSFTCLACILTSCPDSWPFSCCSPVLLSSLQVRQVCWMTSCLSLSSRLCQVGWLCCSLLPACTSASKLYFSRFSLAMAVCENGVFSLFHLFSFLAFKLILNQVACWIKLLWFLLNQTDQSDLSSDGLERKTETLHVTCSIVTYKNHKCSILHQNGIYAESWNFCLCPKEVHH